jgi:general stress protein YciG
MANTKEDRKGSQNLERENGTQTKSGTSNRGFASMDPARQREIASEGGRAAHASGNAHEFSSEEAREAGRKGGESRGKNSNNKDRKSGGRNND